MPLRIFITGATGYIGGDILHEIVSNCGPVSVNALVRDASRAKAIEEKYPQVTLIEGDLDSHELIEDQVSKADVVINAANAKHVSVVQSIKKGILKAKKSTTIFWLQISGASVLSIPDIKDNRFGEASQKSFDDLENAIELRDLIDSNPARAVDQHVIEFAQSHPEQVRTALLFPPIVFGEGRGLGNTKSIQIPTLCQFALARHRSVYVGKGQACWGNVHIADLATLAADLVNASIRPTDEHELWNANGLYLLATGEMTWLAIAKCLSKAASSHQQEAPLESLDAQGIDQLFPHGSVLFGTNARSSPGRGAKYFGYHSTKHSLEEEIPVAFRRELEAL